MPVDIPVLAVSLLLLSYPISRIDFSGVPSQINFFDPIYFTMMVTLGVALYKQFPWLMKGAVVPVILAVSVLAAMYYGYVFILAPALLVVAAVMMIGQIDGIILRKVWPFIVILALSLVPIKDTWWTNIFFYSLSTIALLWYVVPDQKQLLLAVSSGTVLCYYYMR